MAVRPCRQPGAARGRHRPQNGLRVADEQDLMTANEERDRKKNSCCHMPPQLCCALGATEVQSSRKKSLKSRLRTDKRNPKSRLHADKRAPFLARRYAPSPRDTREAGRRSSAEAPLALIDLCGMSQVTRPPAGEQHAPFQGRQPRRNA